MASVTSWWNDARARPATRPRRRFYLAGSAGGAGDRRHGAGRLPARRRQPGLQQRRTAQRHDGDLVGRKPPDPGAPDPRVSRRGQAALRLSPGRFAAGVRRGSDGLRPEKPGAPHRQAGAAGGAMMRMRINQRGGFTLIELLVAISILAMVAVLGWRGLDGIVRARVALTQQMEVTRGMQLAFAQMQSDCEHIPVDGVLLGTRPYLLFDKDKLTLVRMVLLENEPTRLQVVSYRLRDGVLLRRESAVTRNMTDLDVMWKAATSDADPAAPVALQAGITGMGVQNWVGGQWQMIQAPLVGGPAPSGSAFGLQVVLQTRDLAAPMIKTFLLGGA